MQALHFSDVIMPIKEYGFKGGERTKAKLFIFRSKFLRHHFYLPNVKNNNAGRNWPGVLEKLVH